ncbi:N-6 DNA methylase [Amycolatopsis azurea]|uniref:N-6 DNA methylase n=1 Tax=Amycolatopsis azurea TaxID=36819 RepID=UPI003827C3E9
MNVESSEQVEALVTAAEIATLAKVTRAAVSNWRKRYPDFPTPARGAGRNALFALSDVDAWLRQHARGDTSSPEVLIWQALRAQYGDDLIRGLADVSDLSVAGTTSPLEPSLRARIDDIAAQSSLAEVVTGLTERFLGSPGRAGAEQVTTPRLANAVRSFAEPATEVVFDPACGIGSLLLAFEDRSGGVAAGQESNPAAARLAAARARFDGRVDVTVKVGDSLRADQWPDFRAALVVCDPPVNVADWGREDLLLDARWEFGVPTRAESELAWVQHCYAHVAPGGRAVVVMPASVAYRKAGRRIRAELVRRGVLTEVVALPAGMAASHPQPVHLWQLTRPVSPDQVKSFVRMVDLTDNDPDGPFEPLSSQVADVSRVDLLDEEVDLTPGRHVVPLRTDHLAEYMAVREALEGGLQRLGNLLPSLASGPGSLDGSTVRMTDLARVGLVTISDGSAVSTSELLDTDYLAGFLRSAANIKRATSGSGSFRVDIRGSRVPQMSIDDQRAYGTAFRTLDEFERCLADLAKWGERAAALARDGLTRGALLPETKESQ